MYATAEPKPSDSQLDAWLTEDVNDIIDMGATRLRLDARETTSGGELVYPPQVVVGVASRKQGKTFDLIVRAKRGFDGRVRASAYDVLVLFLTDKLLATYRGLLDCETGDILIDAITEYHYRDIVGISSASVPLPKELEAYVDVAHGLGTCTLLAQVFKISIVNSEEVSVNIGYGESADEIDAGVAWPNGQTLGIVQRMVRARKVQ